MANLSWTLHDGRKVGITGFGDPVANDMIVFCHPAPGSSDFDPDPLVTDRSAVHVIGLDRPGYGASDPLPVDDWPTIVGAANDIAEYLHDARASALAQGIDSLGKVGVIGWSAGGRVALALASLHPQLVDRVVLAGTPAPNSAVEWVPPHFAEINAQALEMKPADAKAKIEGMLAAQLPDELIHPDESGDAADLPTEMLGLSEADSEALEGAGVTNRISHMLRDAFAQGVGGVAADILSYASDDWGFDFDKIDADVLLVYGENDPVAGQAHAGWFASQLPNSELAIVPGVGHLAIVPEWKRILKFLVDED